MEIQEIIVFAIVVAALLFAARAFFRQFKPAKGSCSKCACCDPTENADMQQPLINNPVEKEVASTN